MESPASYGEGRGVRGCRNFSTPNGGQCIPCTQSCDESRGCMLVPSYQLYDTNRYGANSNFNKYKGLFTHTNNVSESTPIPTSQTDISDTDKGLWSGWTKWFRIPKLSLA